MGPCRVGYSRKKNTLQDLQDGPGSWDPRLRPAELVGWLPAREKEKAKPACLRGQASRAAVVPSCVDTLLIGRRTICGSGYCDKGEPGLEIPFLKINSFIQSSDPSCVPPVFQAESKSWASETKQNRPMLSPWRGFLWAPLVAK